MIFSTFFPGADGQFDFKLMLVSFILLVIGVAVLVWRLPVMLRTGQTRFYAFGVRRVFERDKAPALYWIVCAFYFFGALFAVAGFVAIMQGWERVHH